HGLQQRRSAQRAGGDRRLQAVVAARNVSRGGALEQGARCQDPRQMGARFAAGMNLEHDPEKWIPVFGEDHAPPISKSRIDRACSEWRTAWHVPAKRFRS